ncbi:MAG: flavin reductase [Epsilonproteobacteria bacterium]|nr:flavin reductase [Campylobacterota bacterium]NPA64625.1 flavin reductase family protein [Campylobacterota bacterium]
MIVDFSDLELKYRYKIMSRTVIPRPIAWIVTEGKSLNIAPFSYYIPLSSNPPTLIVSIGHKKDGSPKDTLKNILEQKRCTICSVNPELLTKMHQSSESLDENLSEAEVFDIPTKRLIEGYPPIVSDTPAAFFCDLFQKIELGGKTIPLILEVKRYYVDDRYVKDKESFDIEIEAVARVGKEYRLCTQKIEP